MLKSCYFTVALAAALLPAMARSAGVTFEGAAKTGADTREVQFRFLCSSNEGTSVTGVLSAELEVPRYEQLRATFDFDPFEGPDANAGALSVLRSGGAHANANDRFRATGSATDGPGSALAFVLEVSASRREAGASRKLGAVLHPLLEGPAQLVWTQGNAKKGGAPMTATLDLTMAQSDQMRGALASCLNGH